MSKSRSRVSGSGLASAPPPISGPAKPAANSSACRFARRQSRCLRDRVSLRPFSRHSIWRRPVFGSGNTLTRFRPHSPAPYERRLRFVRAIVRFLSRWTARSARTKGRKGKPSPPVGGCGDASGPTFPEPADVGAEDRDFGGGFRRSRCRSTSVHPTSGCLCMEIAPLMYTRPIPHVVAVPFVAPQPPERRCRSGRRGRGWE